jgi:hypothetical protein
MDMMYNFSELSLNDIDIPEFPELPSFLSVNNENSIMESETIEILFINISSYEDSSITFEDLQQKLIEFYFNEASNDMKCTHLNNIISNITCQYTYEKILQSSYDNITMILIEFINNSYGTEYLKDIYNMNCLDI